jgi:chromosome segregation ATPase
MPDDDELERKFRKLAVEHAETRWLALRLDDDVKEMRQDIRAIRATQGEHTAVLNEHTAVLNEHTAVLNEHTVLLNEHSAVLTEHTARFDSIDSQLRSLTQLVGEALHRLPGDPEDGEPSGRAEER